MGKIINLCLNCNKEFITDACEIKRGGGKYCSRKCHLIYSQKEKGFNNKGGQMQHKGYVLIWSPEHPNNLKGYVPQHRLVMEKYLGRLLNTTELIHHINGNKSDNNLENLELISPSNHSSLHGNQRAILIMYKKEMVSFAEACRQLNIGKLNVRRFMKRNNLNHQQAIDYYSKKLNTTNEIKE